MVTRRSLLGGAVAATGAGLLTTGGLTPLLGARSAEASATGAAGVRPVAVPPPFSVRMPMAPVLQPISTLGGQDTYAVTVKEVAREIIPGVQTKVLTYDGHFPGPVLRARSGRKVVIRHRNTLTMPVSVHLHGGSVSPENDGGPMDTFAPNTSRTYTYPNQQPGAGLWFHDHAHHMESEHVFRGLSAAYLLSDETERSLPLPSGQYEVPIALRDARFDEAGQLVYVMDDVFGRTTILANGRPSPYVEVAARKYRFRLLNSSNMRFFQLRLSDGGQMIQIGSDGGLLEAPSRRTRSGCPRRSGRMWSSTSRATGSVRRSFWRTPWGRGAPTRWARCCVSTWCARHRMRRGCRRGCGPCRRWRRPRSSAASC